MQREAILSFMAMSYGEDGILRMRVLENARIDVDEIRLQQETIKRLGVTPPYVALVDTRADFHLTKQAQELLASMSHERIATALVSNNPVSRMIANTYVSVFRPERPTRLFSNEEDAIAWLSEKKAEYVSR